MAGLSGAWAPAVQVSAPEEDAAGRPQAAPLIDGWMLRHICGGERAMRVLIISHGHPDFSIGGAEVASHALFRAIGAQPGHEVHYLSRAPTSVRRHARDAADEPAARRARDVPAYRAAGTSSGSPTAA